MTKEELEHEHIREIAENYVNESWGSYLDLDEVDLVMAGIGVGKIIASEQEKRIADLEKENAELKEQGDKWFVFETEAGNWGMDKATQYTVDRHNYFYGTKEECQKWGVEHKIKDYTGHKYCYDRLDNQLTKAKEIIKNLLILKKDQHGNTDIGWRVEVTEQAEQFLKEIEK